MPETRHFLRFAGRLFENGEFEPEPGWETETASARPEPVREYEVALCDAEGHVLVTVSPGVDRALCRDVGDAMRWTRLIAYLPLHPDGRSVELYWQGRLRHRAELAARRPAIAITRLDARDDAVALAWRATHDRPLVFHVVFVDGRGRAFSVARGLEERAVTVDTSRLPGGDGCRLAVQASDGLRSSHALSEPFRVRVKPLRVSLTSPLDGEVLAPDQPLTLRGQALDAGGAAVDIERLRWLVDGREAARGARLALCAPQAPGAHRIALTVDGDAGRAEVVVHIRERNPAEQRWRDEAAELGLVRASDTAAPPSTT